MRNYDIRLNGLSIQEEKDMTKFMLQRMSGNGGECTAVPLPELKNQLQTQFNMGTAAVRADSHIMAYIHGLEEQDAQRIEVLLVPNVCGEKYE